MKILISSIAVFTSLVVVYFSVPGERFDRGPSASANSLPADLDVYLAESERQIPDIRPGAEKSIIWAGEPGTKTEFSVVYVHGFSASKEESRPVPPSQPPPYALAGQAASRNADAPKRRSTLD